MFFKMVENNLLQIMQGSKHFPDIMMTNRTATNATNDGLDFGKGNSQRDIASFPMSPNPNFNRFRSISPPSTGDSSASSGSGSLSSVINRNSRYFKTYQHCLYIVFPPFNFVV